MFIYHPVTDMKNKVLVSQFPYELKLAIKGLNDEKRQKILVMLHESGKVSFSEISRQTSIERPLLTHHLKLLMKSLLVEHFYEHTVGDDRFSFYQISSLGSSILKALDSALNPIPTRTWGVTSINIVEAFDNTNSNMMSLERKEGERKLELAASSSGTQPIIPISSPSSTRP